MCVSERKYPVRIHRDGFFNFDIVVYKNCEIHYSTNYKADINGISYPKNVGYIKQFCKKYSK